MSTLTLEKPEARKVQSVPLLVAGDRLALSEYFRRYEAMPQIKKAELIEGVVYMSSPVRVDEHGIPESRMTGWLEIYRIFTPGLQSAANTTLRLDESNAPQPDVFLRIAPGKGGQSTTNERGYAEGAPELVVEVSASSASYDLHDKMETYRRNGVLEYIVWRTEEEEIDWFVLREQRYERLEADENGIIESTIFPGLRLDVAAIMQDEMSKLLNLIQEGVKNPEHDEFVRRLRDNV